MSRPESKPWTAADLATAKAMRAEGKSSAAIALVIGHSRSAVTGKLWRLANPAKSAADRAGSGRRAGVRRAYIRGGAPKPPKALKTHERVAPGHHPLVNWLASEITAQMQCDPTMASTRIADRAGVCRDTPRSWFRDGATPSLPTFDAMAGALGYRLAVVPLGDDDDAEAA